MIVPDRSFFERSSLEVAPELLGARNEPTPGRIPGLIGRELAKAVPGPQAHPIRMQDRDRIVGKHDIARGIEYE